MTRVAALRRVRPSGGFVAALAGVGFTLVGWYGPWAWPAAPAFAVLSVVFGKGEWWPELGYGVRAAVLVLLIAVNVTTWALLLRLAVAVARRIRRSS